MTVAAPTECVHHDKISTPQGLISKAKCLKCGREREYANYRWPDYNNEPLQRRDEGS